MDNSPCLAVVAIHGVGDQTPNRTAQSVANLLLTLNQESEAFSKPYYANFTETRFRIPVQPLHQGEPQPTDCSQQLTHDLLKDYQLDQDKPNTTYETMRLEGKREFDGMSLPVHVYDMYWADLSRLASGLHRLFGALFMIIFHLGDIGRHTAAFAERAEEQEGPARLDQAVLWGQVRILQWFAVWLLTGPLVILNLYEVAIALLILPAALPDSKAPYVSCILTVLILATTFGWLLMRFWHTGLFEMWAAAWDQLGRVLPRPIWKQFEYSSSFIAWTFALGLAVGLGVWLNMGWIDGLGPYRLLVLGWAIVASRCLYYLLYWYARSRDDSGSIPWWTGIAAILFGLVTISLLLGRLFTEYDDPKSVFVAGFTTFELLYVLVFGCWLMLLALIGVQFVLLLWIWQQNRGNHRARRAARRAVWTVLISLIHPTAVFRVLTLVMWAILFSLLTKLTPNISYEPWLLPFRPGTPKEFMTEILRNSETLAFTSAVAMIVLALLLSAWALFPVVWAEVKPPPRETKPAPMGQWLDHGYTMLTGAVLCMGLAIFLLYVGYLDKALEIAKVPVTPMNLLLLALVLSVWMAFPVLWAKIKRRTVGSAAISETKWLDSTYWTLASLAACVLISGLLLCVGYLVQVVHLGIRPVSRDLGFPSLLIAFSGLISGVFVAVLSLGGPFEKLVLGFHSVVAVLLDVDNYLREFPRNRTPRARMFARYSSLLRYLCKWRDGNGKPYCGLVIVAHSQGTVITADLLRFLNRRGHKNDGLGPLGGEMKELGVESEQLDDEAKQRLPVYLLTVGSPLRQLYGWRLPHLYDWADNTSAEPMAEQTVAKIAASARPTELGPQGKPDPLELRVECWFNGYRSGDYVGRSLWRLPDQEYQMSWGPDAIRREGCIGAGAHTHYLDSDCVAKALDVLIAKAGGAGQAFELDNEKLARPSS